MMAKMETPPITAKLVSGLLPHRERDKLDFKECDYDWSDKEKSRNELAKDLIAMANRLAPGDDPSYILLGVLERDDHTGEVVGLKTPHLRDEALHQKVSNVGLNKVPSFIYAPVKVDGLDVGVYQILPGGRPYYFMSGRFKYQALQRCGSATELASPDEIYQWAKSDDPVSEELRTTKLDETKARAMVRGDVESLQINNGGRAREQRFRVSNHGQLPFTIKRATAIFQFNDAFHEMAFKRGLDREWRAPKWSHPIGVPGQTLVLPGQPSESFSLETRYNDIRNEFRSNARIVLGEVDSFDWQGAYLECTIEVEVDSAGGKAGVLTKTFRWQ
jgi:hypothetical protein